MGQTTSLTHLAPYVRKSYNNYLKQVKEEGEDLGLEYTQEQITKIANKRLRKEIKDGVQTIHYQINTISSRNGRFAVVKPCEPCLKGVA